MVIDFLQTLVKTDYSDFLFRLKKLMTHEDGQYLHIHKLCGFFVLGHFIYRYFHLFRYGHFGFETTNDIHLLLVHAGLSISSLVFHIPTKRNRASPMIYPEFRWHSIFFALRSIIASYLHYYGAPKPFLVLTCFATMGLADTATYFLKKKEDNDSTMRNMPFSEKVTEENQRIVTQFHSKMQIGATLFILHNVDTAYSPLCAIQVAAFLMTLVRKNIIKSTDWHFIYSVLLIMNYFTYLGKDVGVVEIYINYICIQLFKRLRFDRGWNKYACWCIVFSVYYFHKTLSYNTPEYNTPEYNAPVTMYEGILKIAAVAYSVGSEFYSMYYSLYM
jgi:hypothetical protein